MINSKYISSKAILEGVMADTQMSDELPWVDVMEWLGSALDLIGVPMQYIKKVTGHKDNPNLDIENYKAKLPCDFYKLRQIAVNGLPCRAATNTFHHLLDGKCFKVGTLISMSNGNLKEIENIKIGDEILSAEGKEDVVIRLFKQNYKGNFYKIYLWGHNIFESTENHPVLTLEGYKSVSNLTNKDYVCLTNSKIKRPHTKINRRFKYDDGFFLGLILAEGSLDINRIKLFFHLKEEKTLGKFVEVYVKNKFDKTVKPLFYRAKSNTVIYDICSKKIRKLYGRRIKGNCWNKEIIEDLTRRHKNYKRGILDGWLAGDGHKRRGQIEGASVSKKLAVQMFNLASELNLFPTIYKQKAQVNKYARSRKNVYKITIRDNRPVINKHGFIIKDENIFRKIRKINIEEYEGEVFNFETNKYHSYVADGIGVHNCCGIDELGEVDGDTFIDNFGNVFNTGLGIKYTNNDISYDLNNDYITLSVEEGEVCISYLAIPTDNLGFPLIPDDVSYKEAVKRFLIMKLDYINWRKDPDSRGLQKIYENSQQEWCWYCGQAGNKAKMPDIDGMESIKSMLIRLKPRFDEHRGFFRFLNISEKRRFK